MPRTRAPKGATLIQRFEHYTVLTSDGCWEWMGARIKGYGTIAMPEGMRRAHRVLYELLRGPIPEGLVLDHLCRNPACVNPEHLEPVTHQENVRRGIRGVLRTHCRNGHPATPENTYVRGSGVQTCDVCRREWNRAAYERSKSKTL